MVCRVLSLIAVSVVTACIPAQAGVPGNSVQVAGRAASFLNPAPSGTVFAAVVYNPGDPESEDEARSIERSIGSGLSAGSMVLRPKRVPTTSLDQLAGARVAFVTRGTNYRQVAAATAARSILSISFDPSCTRQGYCVLTVGTGSRVQIVVSRAASKAANLRFNSSFLMLIKEI